jgi:hypothetical protein
LRVNATERVMPLMTTESLTYACSTGTCGTNRCRSTLCMAAATGADNGCHDMTWSTIATRKA